MNSWRSFMYWVLGFFLAFLAAGLFPLLWKNGEIARWLPILFLFSAFSAFVAAAAVWTGIRILIVFWDVFRMLCPDAHGRVIAWTRRWTMAEAVFGGPASAAALPPDPMDGDAFDTAVLRGGPGGRLRVVDALLKARGAIIREIRSGEAIPDHVFNLMLVVFAFGGLYGAIVGIFGGGIQVLYAAAKVPLILLGTSLLCLPTFYVFNSILGSRLSLGQTTALVFLLAAAAAILLMGFAPNAWFFTVSAGGPVFMSIFHIAVFAVGLLFGVSWLNASRRYLRRLAGGQASAPGGFFALWIALYAVVGCQMAYYLRPILDAGPFCTGERGLFFEFFGKL